MMNNMNGMNQQNGNGNDVSLNYQPNDILQKEFKTKMRGYDPTEVDQFLDGIIKDYETFSNEISQLKSENERLMQARNAGAGNTGNAAQNFQQPRQNNRMRPQQKPAMSATAESSTNYDILKRISNLEKRVFGRDFSNGLPEDHESKQFASAVVPNPSNMNNHAGVESGHTEINPGMNQNQQSMNNNFNNPNTFQPNRPMNNGSNQGQGNFNGNFNNSNNNMNQF
jgi:DivIVA domain|nr:cell division regulator GpsB [Companilactobacillus zhachilii]